MASTGAPRGKKKGRSFLYKARKYGKKGMYGRGKNVDEETYNYFVRVMERLKEDFEDDEEKEIFVTNVFEQTEEKEMDLMCNQVISKVIEKLLALAKPETLLKFASICLKEMRIICTDPYASHVLEALMHIALDKVLNGKEEVLGEHQASFQTWLCSICQFTFNNVEDFIMDMYASHIIRTALQCVSGVVVGVNVMKSHRSRRHLDSEKVEATSNQRKMPKAFSEILEEFAQRFIAWPQLSDLVQSDSSSAVIQTFLYSIAGTIPTMCEKLIRILVEDIFPSTEGNILEYSSIIHLLEVCLEISNEETFLLLHDKYFRGQLKNLAQDVATKFSVVKLLEGVKSEKLFADIFAELAPAMEDIFGAGCGTVVVALASTCRRLATLQSSFLQNLMEAFHCWQPESRQVKIVHLVSRLVTFEVAATGGQDGQPEFPIHYMGSQIVQTLLHFNKPIKLVQSLLETETAQLKDMACDPCGSFIIDAFVASEHVGEKSREKLIHKLQGVYFSLATSKHGSRSLDALWQSSDIKGRLVIGEELLQKEAALTSNMFGRILSDKYALPLLKKNKADWKTSQEKDNKKRKLFAELIDAPALDQEVSTKKTKRSKKKKTSPENETLEAG